MTRYSDHRHQLDTKLASLTRMVVEDTARTKQGLDSLYRRLVTLIVLRCHNTDSQEDQTQNSKHFKTLSHLSFLQKIILLPRSGLGNPTDPAVVSEANTCLATVFPVSQLVAFQALVRIEKKTKIRQLTAVVKVTPDT